MNDRLGTTSFGHLLYYNRESVSKAICIRGIQGSRIMGNDSIGSKPNCVKYFLDNQLMNFAPRLSLEIIQQVNFNKSWQ